MTKKISKAGAEKLWSEIREGFVNQERLLKEAIVTRSWEVLGYASFSEAWTDRLAGIPLATDALKVHVVYALLDDSYVKAVAPAKRAELVAETIGKGITPTTIRKIEERKSAGVTVEQAERLGLRVRVASSDKPKTRAIVLGPFSHEEYAEFKRKAEAKGSTVEKIARKAVEAHFARLKG